MKRVHTFLVLASLFALSSAAFAQQSAPADTSSTRSPLLVGTDALVGSPVRTMDGRDIGKVFGLMLDPNDGRVVSAIVTTGGVLGVGASTMAVPWSSMKVGQDQGKVVMTLTQIPRQRAQGRTTRPVVAVGQPADRYKVTAMARRAGETRSTRGTRSTVGSGKLTQRPPSPKSAASRTRTAPAARSRPKKQAPFEAVAPAASEGAGASREERREMAPDDVVEEPIGGVRQEPVPARPASNADQQR